MLLYEPEGKGETFLDIALQQLGFPSYEKMVLIEKDDGSNRQLCSQLLTAMEIRHTRYGDRLEVPSQQPLSGTLSKRFEKAYNWATQERFKSTLQLMSGNRRIELREGSFSWSLSYQVERCFFRPLQEKDFEPLEQFMQKVVPNMIYFQS